MPKGLLNPSQNFWHSSTEKVAFGNMKRAPLLTVVLFLGLTSLAQGELQGPLLGHVTEKGSGPEYEITFNFGIEQWENGKRAEGMNEQWHLQCNNPSIFTKRPTTWCSLNRTTFYVFEGELFAASHLHESLEGTLKLIRTDWGRGRLDFNFVNKDKSTTEVKIQMILEGESIYLESFQAFRIARGVFRETPMTTIEFRIPQYTYTVNAPIKFRGLRSEDEKQWDDLLSSLSQQDQEAWKDFKAEGMKKCSFLSERETHTEEQMLKKIIPGWEEGRKLTVDEKNLLTEYFSGQFSECLASSNISLEGQKKIQKTMGDTFWKGKSK